MSREQTAYSKIVLVTGSRTGFGRLISTTLARRGYSVFASMRDIAGRNRNRAADLQEWGRDENLRLSVIELDVTDEASVQQAVENVIGDAGKIDVVVNNAGISAWGLVESHGVDQAKGVFETNVFGPWCVNRAALPYMRRRRSGLLIHLSSVAGRLVLPSMGLYCASKFALEAMAETLRYELSQSGIDSVTVEPSPYATALSRNALEAIDRERAADYGAIARLPSKIRDAVASAAGDPQKVADRVLQLIETPLGGRPVRTLVGELGERFQSLNDMTLLLQAVAMQEFGLAELLALRVQNQSREDPIAPPNGISAEIANSWAASADRPS
jgi:NAD(P)-dependent dehydrogenase (short-subunit alcohol dehydrogenase family)